MALPSVPKCFDGFVQFHAWFKAARLAPPETELRYCEDCTREYQARMKEQGRCGRPGVSFTKDGTAIPAPEGQLSRSQEYRRRMKQQRNSV
ncbi:MAG: hypothetical protein KGH75_06085 [Rhodospirillales bacterium]|nr:hypothetical protein [Rhodospirillales bacterium]